VAADPLGRRLDDDVCSPRERLARPAALAEGVVADDGDLVLGGDGLDGVEVGNGAAGVADDLEVDGLGVLVDEGLDLARLGGVEKAGLDAELLREGVLELRVRAAVPAGRGARRAGES